MASFRYHVQTFCEADPAFSSVGTKGSFPGSNAAGAWNWPPNSKVRIAWS